MFIKYFSSYIRPVLKHSVLMSIHIWCVRTCVRA